MLSFLPNNWEVRYLQDMETFTTEPGGNKLSLTALLTIKPARTREGSFRLGPEGIEDINIRLPIIDFIRTGHGKVHRGRPVPSWRPDNYAA
jgi:hypothetical protein